MSLNNNVQIQLLSVIISKIMFELNYNYVFIKQLTFLIADKHLDTKAIVVLK